MNYKEEIVNLLKDIVDIDVSLVEVPANPELGDYAVPCFTLARVLKKSPNQIAVDLAQKIPPSEVFSRIDNKGPYLNFFADRPLFIGATLQRIIEDKKKYGHLDIGKGKNIVIDFSSPNIAKPFGIAHIRSTVIGNAIHKCYDALGYNTVRINHLGDWGTQFGKLMVAYMKWGDEQELKKGGIDYLVEIYIEFGERAKESPELNDKARQWFKNLEDGHPKAVKLWKHFKELSLKEFNKYYDRLGIEFDYFHGESFYNDVLDDTIDTVKSQLPTEVSEGALIVDLSNEGIKTPVILRKSDGATTYHTRDIAAALYRLKTFDPYKIIYVVGIPQKLHFDQLFKVLEMLGKDRSKFEYVGFGNMTYEGEMMSTRRGNFIKLSDVLNKAIKLAREIIEEKNPDLENKGEIAEQIGIGAIIFGDLFNERTHDIDFSWDKALNLKGETAPYLQYTHARICSIKRKANVDVTAKIDPSLLKTEIEYSLAKTLAKFPNKVLSSVSAHKPHIIATYLIDVGQFFNKFYDRCHIINESPELRDARLLLAECTRIVINNGLALLGIESPSKM